MRSIYSTGWFDGAVAGEQCKGSINCNQMEASFRVARELRLECQTRAFDWQVDLESALQSASHPLSGRPRLTGHDEAYHLRQFGSK